MVFTIKIYGKEEFELYASGKKTFCVVPYNDEFSRCKVGDTVRLTETNWGYKAEPTGRKLSKKISHIDHPIELKPEYCVLCLKDVADTAYWVDVTVPQHKKVSMKDGVPEKACKCSKCNEFLVASDEYPVMGRFCPNCGRKMRK